MANKELVALERAVRLGIPKEEIEQLEARREKLQVVVVDKERQFESLTQRRIELSQRRTQLLHRAKEARDKISEAQNTLEGVWTAGGAKPLEPSVLDGLDFLLELASEQIVCLAQDRDRFRSESEQAKNLDERDILLGQAEGSERRRVSLLAGSIVFRERLSDIRAGQIAAVTRDDFRRIGNLVFEEVGRRIARFQEEDDNEIFPELSKMEGTEQELENGLLQINSQLAGIQQQLGE